MKKQSGEIWVIKDVPTGTFFTLLGGAPHFTSDVDFAQRFSSEKDAVLCEEHYIHPDVTFLDRDTLPTKLNQ